MKLAFQIKFLYLGMIVLVMLCQINYLLHF